MKLLIFSDLHLHEWTQYSSLTKDGLNSRLHHQLLVLKEIALSAIKNGVTTLIFCGDLLHQRGKITPAINYVLSEFLLFIKGKNLNCKILLGNHDMQTEKFHGLHILNETSFNVCDTPTVSCSSLAPATYFSFVPYTADRTKLEKQVKLGRNQDHFLFLHQGVAGVPMGSGYVVDENFHPGMLPDSCLHAFTGHYHTHKKVTDKLTIVGNPIAQNWNDVNEEKGWLIFDTETLEIEKINSFTAPLFLSGKLEDLKHRAVNNFLKIENQPQDVWQDIKTLLYARGALSVEFISTESLPQSLLLPTSSSINVPNMIENILNKRKLVDPYFKKVGEQLREGSYEI